MVPENRLETMLKQAIELQIANCLYHDNRNMSCTLYSDHVCEKYVCCDQALSNYTRPFLFCPHLILTMDPAWHLFNFFTGPESLL